MDHLWIPITLATALMQALRFAVLKVMNWRLTTSASSYARAVFGLPWLVAYLLLALHVTQDPIPEFAPAFWAYSIAAGLAQFTGTALIVYLFQTRNFAVGTMLFKTDVILTALIGSYLFSEVVTAKGWLAICVTVVGVMLASAGKFSAKDFRSGDVGMLAALFGRTTQLGLFIGLIFALSYLFLREAIISIDSGGPFTRAAWGAVAMSGTQLVIVGVWLAATEPRSLLEILRMPAAGMLLGIVSGLGTIGWFVASALQNASYVAAVAQSQVIFTLGISWFYFRERVTALDSPVWPSYSVAFCCSVFDGASPQAS